MQNVAHKPDEASIPELMARLAELARAVEEAQIEIRRLAPKRHNASTERRLAELYRELDAIADQAARIERRLPLMESQRARLAPTPDAGRGAFFSDHSERDILPIRG